MTAAAFWIMGQCGGRIRLTVPAIGLRTWIEHYRVLGFVVWEDA